MIKIAMIVDAWFPYIGGGQINAWEISRRLAQAGCRIDIITRNQGSDNLNYPKNLNVIKFGQKVKPLDYPSRLVFLLKAYLYVYKRDYRIVHGQAFLPGIIVGMLKVFKNVSTVFTVHGTSLGTTLNNPFKKLVEKIILLKIPYSAQITVSRDFQKIKNVNKNVNYIPNGVNLKNFGKVKASKSSKPSLIFVGRLHPQKNLPNLLKALAIAKKEIPQIKLHLVGEGQEKESLIKLVNKLTLVSNVTFHGEVIGNNLIKLYKSSHVFILPSIYEGLPLAMLEAWAAKLPVIVNTTGDCRFLVKNGVNGFLLKNPREPSDIAGLIVKALKAKNLQQMGQNGYNLVAENFSWDKSAQMTLQLYESLTKAQN